MRPNGEGLLQRSRPTTGMWRQRNLLGGRDVSMQCRMGDVGTESHCDIDCSHTVLQHRRRNESHPMGQTKSHAVFRLSMQITQLLGGGLRAAGQLLCRQPAPASWGQAYPVRQTVQPLRMVRPGPGRVQPRRRCPARHMLRQRHPASCGLQRGILLRMRHTEEQLDQ